MEKKLRPCLLIIAILPDTGRVGLAPDSFLILPLCRQREEWESSWSLDNQLRLTLYTQTEQILVLIRVACPAQSPEEAVGQVCVV